VGANGGNPDSDSARKSQQKSGLGIDSKFGSQKCDFTSNSGGGSGNDMGEKRVGPGLGWRRDSRQLQYAAAVSVLQQRRRIGTADRPKTWCKHDWCFHAQHKAPSGSRCSSFATRRIPNPGSKYWRRRPTPTHKSGHGGQRHHPPARLNTCFMITMFLFVLVMFALVVHVCVDACERVLTTSSNSPSEIFASTFGERCCHPCPPETCNVGMTAAAF
jgi:hypothetical protein